MLTMIMSTLGNSCKSMCPPLWRRQFPKSYRIAYFQPLNELKSRGVEDVFTACVDGLKGLPEAIESAFPNAERDFEWRLALSNKLKQSLERQICEVCGVRALKR